MLLCWAVVLSGLVCLVVSVGDEYLIWLDKQFERYMEDGIVDHGTSLDPDHCVVDWRDALFHDPGCGIRRPRLVQVENEPDENGYVSEAAQYYIDYGWDLEGMSGYTQKEMNPNGANWRVFHPCTLMDHENADIKLNDWIFSIRKEWKNINSKKLYQAIVSTGWGIIYYGSSLVFGTPKYLSMGSFFLIDNMGTFVTARHVLHTHKMGPPGVGQELAEAYSSAFLSVTHQECTQSYDYGFSFIIAKYFQNLADTDIERIDSMGMECGASDIAFGHFTKFKPETHLQILKKTDLCGLGDPILVIGHPTEPKEGVTLKDYSKLTKEQFSSIIFSGTVAVEMGNILDINQEIGEFTYHAPTSHGISGSVVVSSTNPLVVCGMHTTAMKAGISNGESRGIYYTHPALARYAQ